MNLNDLVRKHYLDLNENDIYIWQYLSHHRNEIALLSLHKIAKNINVSETSITRFAKKLGLTGFQELKTYLKWENFDEESFNKDAIHVVTRNFQETIKMLQEKDFTDIFEIFMKAKILYLYPTGEVQKNMALEFKREFIYAKKIVYIIENVNELDLILNSVSKDDAFIIISLSGENEMSLVLAKLLKRYHVPSIGIAGTSSNSLFSLCDHYIEFKSQYLDLGYEHLNHCSTAQFFLVVNYLFLRFLEYLQLIKKGESYE